MADTTGKTPGKGLFGWLTSPGSKGPDPKLIGEPAEPAITRRYRERLAGLTKEQRQRYTAFMFNMPAVESGGVVDYDGQIDFPTVEVAYSTDHGQKPNNEDGVFVDPLRDIGVVVDGISTGGNGSTVTRVILSTVEEWTHPERAAALQAELRSRNQKDTPENRLKLIGHKAHEQVKLELSEGNRTGGAVLAGTLIEDNKLYSFVLGDAMNMVIRDDRVVFCSRPTSRLQKFIDTFNVSPKDVKAKVDAYLDSTPVEKIRGHLGYGKNISLETIKRTIWSDPIKAVGFETAEDVEIETFDLQPDDTILSVTDGILEPLGLRVIPTKYDNASKKRVFDPGYNSNLAFPMFFDPIAKLGSLVGRNAKETRNNILDYLARDGAKTSGVDHRTILVRRLPIPRISREEDHDRTQITPFTPPKGRVPAHDAPSGDLPRIGDDYENDKTPVDQARIGLPRPEEPGFPPLVSPGLVPRSRDILPPEPAARVVPPPPPPPVEPPPLPNEEVQKRRELDALRRQLRALALQEHDVRHDGGDERAADAMLWEIWRIEDRIEIMEGRKRKGNRPEWLRVYRNYISEQIEKAQKAVGGNESQGSQLKKFEFSKWTAWLEQRIDLILTETALEATLLWLDGHFDLMRNNDPVDLIEANGRSRRLRIREVFPADDPNAPNVVVMDELGESGGPEKKMALTKAEWVGKLEKGATLSLAYMFESFPPGELNTMIKSVVDGVRSWFKGGRFSLKVEEGRFAGTAFEPLYRELGETLHKYPDTYEPSSLAEMSAYAAWAERIKQLELRIHELSVPKTTT